MSKPMTSLEGNLSCNGYPRCRGHYEGEDGEPYCNCFWGYVCREKDGDDYPTHEQAIERVKAALRSGEIELGYIVTMDDEDFRPIINRDPAPSPQTTDKPETGDRDE
jgi:hypothetical protein